jgi:hypothetical protein
VIGANMSDQDKPLGPNEHIVRKKLLKWLTAVLAIIVFIPGNGIAIPILALLLVCGGLWISVTAIWLNRFIGWSVSVVTLFGVTILLSFSAYVSLLDWRLASHVGGNSGVTYSRITWPVPRITGLKIHTNVDNEELTRIPGFANLKRVKQISVISDRITNNVAEPLAKVLPENAVIIITGFRLTSRALEGDA